MKPCTVLHIHLPPSLSFFSISPPAPFLLYFALHGVLIVQSSLVRFDMLADGSSVVVGSAMESPSVNWLMVQQTPSRSKEGIASLSMACLLEYACCVMRRVA
jgi:hypothetical protein